MQLVSRDDVVVFAAARSPNNAPGLQDLQAQNGERLHLVALDVTDENSVKVPLIQNWVFVSFA